MYLIYFINYGKNGDFMKKKMLLQSATLISLLFAVNSFLYGKNTTIDYGDGVVYEGEIGHEELPEESKYNPIHWIVYKVFGVMEPHGRGKLTFSNGNSYEGGFVHGDMTGKGKYTFADGNSVEGDFKNGVVNGKGKHTFPDGSYYEGDFKNGEMTGKGKIFDKNGNIIQEGSFLNGQKANSYSLFVRDGYVIYKDLITDEETVMGKADNGRVVLEF